MKERLLADLDDRIARHVGGDPSGVLDPAALGLVTELTAHGEPDAGSLTRVAALHLCRYEALRPDGDTDLRVAKVLYTRLHEVDPRLVPPDVRTFFGFTAPHEQGAALLREYERTRGPGQLERAISLLRQAVLEGHSDRKPDLATALLHRYALTGRPQDREEAARLG